MKAAAEKLGVKSIPADVTSDESVAQLFQHCGVVNHVDGHCAAQLRTGPFKTVPMEDVRATMEAKFWGAWRVARAAQIQAGGSLTLVSRVSKRSSAAPRRRSWAPQVTALPLARSLALELAPVVTAVSTGIIDTPRRRYAGGRPRETLAKAPPHRCGSLVSVKISHGKS